MFEFVCCRQLFDLRPNKINTALKDIGLVSNVEKMYTLHPVQIFYYTHNIPNYSPRNHTFLNVGVSKFLFVLKSFSSIFNHFCYILEFSRCA